MCHVMVFNPTWGLPSTGESQVPSLEDNFSIRLKLTSVCELQQSDLLPTTGLHH